MERNPFLGWPVLLQQRPRSVREVTGVRRDKVEIKTDETGAGSSSGRHTCVDKHKWFRTEACKTQSTGKRPKRTVINITK